MVALLLLICWPLAELFVAIVVAGAIGVPATLLALAVTVPLGIWLLRASGRAAWRRLGSAVAAGRLPAREVIDGGLVVAGSTLLIVPGFIGDVIGLALLLPPTRSLARRVLARNYRSRLFVQASRFGGTNGAYDVDSTATDLDSAQLPR